MNQWCPPPPFPPDCPPPWPPCPPPTFSPPTPPWYPGANAGVSFGTMFPPNPCRGHFLWDGAALWIWDGVGWDKIGPSAPSSAGIPEAPIDGNLYGRENAAWMKITPPVLPTIVIATVFYNSSQMITIPVGSTSAQVVMWGSTGGTGGATGGNTNVPASSGGTGGGGYLEKYLTNLVPGQTLSFTQGTGGAGGAPAGNGGGGTVTTLASGSQSIPPLTCNGSAGSIGVNNVNGAGSVGGSATGGDINIVGQTGTDGTGNSQHPIGDGGRNFFSVGADGVFSMATSVSGNPGNPGGLRITWTP